MVKSCAFEKKAQLFQKQNGEVLSPTKGNRGGAQTKKALL